MEAMCQWKEYEMLWRLRTELSQWVYQPVFSLFWESRKAIGRNIQVKWVHWGDMFMQVSDEAFLPHSYLSIKKN